jgi:hypothetical protein
MERQADYAAAGIVMPIEPVRRIIAIARRNLYVPTGAFIEGTRKAEDLITSVARAFDVSKDAASVRLRQMRALVAASADPSRKPSWGLVRCSQVIEDMRLIEEFACEDVCPNKVL